MSGRYRSARLPVHGPPAIGWFHQKSTVGGRLSEKKGRRRRGGKEEKKKRGEEGRIPNARAPSPPAGRGHFFSRTWRKIEERPPKGRIAVSSKKVDTASRIVAPKNPEVDDLEKRLASLRHLLGHGTHDQLCDAVQENLLNSDAEFNTVGQLSALSLQEKGRSQGTSSSAR
ncbi:hypothetical protein BHM03_00050096 [Ensete ventricosum]|nr:hypothetical protein BHM03_00050096 [Ensete ventricosum]